MWDFVIAKIIRGGILCNLWLLYGTKGFVIAKQLKEEFRVIAYFFVIIWHEVFCDCQTFKRRILCIFVIIWHEEFCDCQKNIVYV